MTDFNDLPRLTPKQEGFVEDYLSTGIAAEAYRQHYSTSNMLDSTVHRRAHDVLTNGKVQARLRHERDQKQAITEELTQKALRHADKALKVITDILGNEKANDAVRLSAAREMLDRGHGKPVSKTELDATVNSKTGDVEDMSDEALMALVKSQGEG